MFNPTTENLWLEVKAAMDETDQQTHLVGSMQRRTVSRWYRKDSSDQEAEPENHGYAYLSNILPQLVSANPKVDIKAARVVGHKVVAQAMQDGCNAWVKDVQYEDIVEPVIVDQLYVRGILLHYLDEDTRFSRGTVTPKAVRVDPRRFFEDALAETTGTTAFQGHWYWKDLDDLLADENLTPAAREKLTASEDVSTNGYERKEGFPKKSGTSMGRERVRCYNVWLRERNTLRVLVETNEVVELYPERPFFGPPTGPYMTFDNYPVPGQTWGLSPFVAVEDQSRDLNLHARAIGRAAHRRKTVGLVESNDVDLGEKLVDAEDGEIMVAKNITGKYVQVEVGGVSQQAYQYTEYSRNRLDRISGLTATVQGSVGSADTATEAKIADDALSNRVRYLKRKVVKCVEGSLEKTCWYLFHTEGIIIPVNRRDPYSGEQLEGLFFGGPSPTDAGAQWDDFDLTVQLNTIQVEATQRADLVALYGLFKDLLTSALTMPGGRWMAIWRDICNVYNMPNLADEWLIPEVFGAFGQPALASPSQVMGAPRMNPQIGAPFQQRRLAHTHQNAPGQFGQPDNSIAADGNVTGPRPQQTAGQAGSVGFNPSNMVA